ncbi:hypothetical protein [Gemella morbillorum]|uniref:hypothetical protein n=1 Tax=Gemella morbillorum TaxID=29391 RepID=UPI0028D1C9AC|nr:hypothetical protein [Gemella morbillorum]
MNNKIKKTFFQKNINRVIFILTISIPLIVLVSILKIPLDKSTYSNNKLSNLITAIQSFLNAILILGTAILLLAFLLIAIEVYKRKKYDQPYYLVTSVIQTFKIRRFLKQDESYIDDKFSKINNNNRVNPVLKNFNKSIKHCIVDVRNIDVIVILKIPRNQQSQKILKDMEQQLLDEVTHLNPDYYFSGLQRNGSYLYIKGNKR